MRAQASNSIGAGKADFRYLPKPIWRKCPDGSEENSGSVQNLTRLRSWDDALEVCVLAAFKGSFSTLSRALDAALLLLLLLLSAGAFSLAFIHAISDYVNEILEVT